MNQYYLFFSWYTVQTVLFPPYYLSFENICQKISESPFYDEAYSLLILQV